MISAVEVRFLSLQVPRDWERSYRQHFDITTGVLLSTPVQLFCRVWYRDSATWHLHSHWICSSNHYNHTEPLLHWSNKNKLCRSFLKSKHILSLITALPDLSCQPLCLLEPTLSRELLANTAALNSGTMPPLSWSCSDVPTCILFK